MKEFIINLPHPMQALISAIFTYLITTLGAAVVFLFKKPKKIILDSMVSFAAGVMIAASFFSLIAPAINMAENLHLCVWLTLVIGVLFGGLFLFICDKIFDHFQNKFSKNSNKNNSLKRIWLLVFSITIHNIPEGLAIGVAFGSIGYNLDGATLAAAFALAMGIGIQNFPEGSAISLPLLREGFSRKKAFFWGQISAIVEPISALLGAILIMKIRLLLPFCLAFAGGAMIYVVVEELIPECQKGENKNIMAFIILIGFCIMMALDVALG